MTDNYKDINRALWNSRTDVHVESEFYDVEGFLAGNTSLKEIELGLLGDIRGKKVLHLQCHFGQDTLSLARMGAEVTGADLSDRAIAYAKELAKRTGLEAEFVCCDIYDLPQHLEGQFDIVFTSYGTIGWLPDLDKWAGVVSHFLRPGGTFVFVEFHPVVWMFDDALEKVQYSYFNAAPIIETENGTYADKGADINNQSISWNHNLAEVLQSLIKSGIIVKDIREYDFSPYNIFPNSTETEPGRYRVAHMGNRLPLVYSVVGELPLF